MPLSDHEESQLRSIAEQFYRESPDLADSLSLPRHSRAANLQTGSGVLLVLAGIACLLAAVAVNVTVLGVAAFLLMLTGAVLAYRSWMYGARVTIPDHVPPGTDGT